MNSWAWRGPRPKRALITHTGKCWVACRGRNHDGDATVTEALPRREAVGSVAVSSPRSVAAESPCTPGAQDVLQGDGDGGRSSP